MKYCEMSWDHGSPSLIFSMEDSKFTMLTLIPYDLDHEMNANVDYRLLNKM